MNITLSVDEDTVQLARKAAGAMGLSLNQAIRNYLEELAGGGSAEQDVGEMMALSGRSAGRSGGVRISRDELHERAPSP